MASVFERVASTVGDDRGALAGNAPVGQLEMFSVFSTAANEER
jgi:hypothetical protein